MNPREGLRATLGSAGLTLTLLSVILVLSVIATVVPQDPTTRVALETLYSPETVYALRVSGVADIFHSGWFIFVLFALAVNLVLGAIDRLPGIWKQAESTSPPALNVEQVLGGHKPQSERFFRAELKSSIGREEFRGLVNDWSRARIGRPRALRDEGGVNELQLAVQRGRLSRLVLVVAQLGLALFAIGLFVSWNGDFEGSLVVNEGGIRAPFMQLLKGKPPGKWKTVSENGRPLPGFVVPDFEVSAGKIDAKDFPGTQVPMTLQTALDFYEHGVRVASRTVSPNHPAWFHGMLFLQGQARQSGKASASLLVTDEQTRLPKKTPPLSAGSEYDGGEYKIKVLEVQEQAHGDEGLQEGPITEEGKYGPAVHIEFTEAKVGEESGSRVERFWVFLNFPDFDSAHRRRARYHLSVLGMAPEMSSEILIHRDPGLFLALAGFLIALLAFFYSLLFSFDRFWFVWLPGRVALVGWSHRAQLFEPRFERAAAQIRARVQRIEKARGDGTA
jgi:cytochrome c biogenesis protein